MTSLKKNKIIFITIGSILLVIGLAIYILYYIGYLGSATIKANNASFPTNQTALPIPSLLEDENPDPNQAEFTITAQEGSMEFINGKETDTLGYNGNYLGPVLRVQSGEEVSVNVNNNLEEATTLHWHGLKVDGEDDGGPHNVIEPGDTWNAQFTINQPAATLWFHPHQSGKTGEQVYNGLAGLFIIDDEVSDTLDIPKDYGENDIPLIIQDKTFDEQGDFNYELSMHDTMMGLLGETLLVNGAINPYVDAPQGMMRLRILNGSNASIYQLQFTDAQPFYQIASDGGFLERPVEMTELTIGPGERAEILVDFSNLQKGDTIQLLNNDIAFMDFIINKDSDKNYTIPTQLTTIEKLDPDDAVKTREFIFQGMGSGVSINGEQMDMDRIDEKIALDSIEIWTIQNYTNMAHPFHAHGVQFQILEREGEPPAENEAGWKDTFLVGQGEDVKVIAKFENEGIFMYHCHILEHEDAGMMGQFLVE